MIKSVLLRNFRNFSDFEFSPPEGVTLITGENGTGKTSILEGIYFASRFESFRTSEDRDMIKNGEDGFFIRCDTKGVRIEVGYNGRRKKIKKNGVFYRSYSKLYGLIPVVIFLPEDIFIVSGPPEVKRKFLDSAIGLLSPYYREVLRDYRQTLKNRNNVIKKIREGLESRESLYLWNRLLSEKGSFIIKERIKFVDILVPHFKEIFGRFTNREVEVKYINKSGTDEKFFRKLAEEMDREIYAGFTLYGPHRDSLMIKLDGEDASTHASYGFQRLIAFSLRIAETELIKRVREEEPVVMVDEVINELDMKNRRVFLEVLTDYPQAILATVSPEIAKFEKFNIFKLEKYR